MNKYHTESGTVLTNLKPHPNNDTPKAIRRETAQRIVSATEPVQDDPNDPWILIDACDTWMRQSKVDSARQELAEDLKRRKYGAEIAAATELM